MSNRLSDLIRFAYDNPELRSEILSQLVSENFNSEDLESFERLSGKRNLQKSRGSCDNPHVRGRPRPGDGECYNVHEDYGSANSGADGSQARRDYMKKYRKNHYDHNTGSNASISRKVVPKPWGDRKTRGASSELVRLAHELPELRDPILNLFFFKTAVDKGFKSPSSKAQNRGCKQVFKKTKELTQKEKNEMSEERLEGGGSLSGDCNRKINEYGSGASKNMKQYMKDYRAKGFLVYDKDEGKEVSSDKGGGSRTDTPDWVGGVYDPSKKKEKKEKTRETGEETTPQKSDPAKRRRRKVAGEVRFIKDDTNSPMNAGNWAWGMGGASREIHPNFKFDPECNEKLVEVLKSSLYALGHSLHAYSIFAKLKSRNISPDGSLGGRGYVQEIKAMRKQYMNIVEALSSLTDTLNDEVLAPHWAYSTREEVMEGVQDLKDNPEKWAEKQKKEEESLPIKTANLKKRVLSLRVLQKYMRGQNEQ